MEFVKSMEVYKTVLRSEAERQCCHRIRTIGTRWIDTNANCGKEGEPEKLPSRLVAQELRNGDPDI